ncbi:MAG: tyrosine-type recombinase/integrase [Streptosporangiaceae bacterium]
MTGGGKRHFGNIRKRTSGRYQARYRGPDGSLRSAPFTFERKSDAARWLALKEAEIRRGDWIDPDAATVLFSDYADEWISDRVLKARTVELYWGLLRNHLLPAFGHLGLGDIDEAAVRRWRRERLDAGPNAERRFGPVTVAKAYRLMHAILATAEDDRLIRRNPCRIDDAGKEDSPEREIVPLPIVFTIAKVIPVRYRALVLLATFAGLRWGELAGLRRGSIDLNTCQIRIIETTAELDSGGLAADTPKSRAGRRTVAFPDDLVPELRWHLERFAQPGERGLVFVGPKGAPLRRSNFRPIWGKACAAAGVPGLHFHDLRHTGSTLAAATGATLKELMARLGHSSTRAAMIYQHATLDRDQVIAKALGGLAREARRTDRDQADNG